MALQAGRNTPTLFMARLCGLADEITRSRAIASTEAELFSILLKASSPLGGWEGDFLECRRSEREGPDGN